MKINDIARLAGVSNMTVSRVINNSGTVGKKTREKIEHIIKEYNYTPNAIARNLAKRQSNTIGVIISDIENHFFGSIIKGISNINDNENLNTILYNTDENLEKEEKAIDLMIEQRVKGCIISIVSSTKSKVNILKLKNNNIPFVLLDREIYNANYSGIFLDDLYGGYIATKSLIENGHKNIAVITGDSDLKNAHDRYLGYIEALKESSFPINENYVYKGDFQINSGVHFVDNILLKNPEITAVFSSNNKMTLGILKRFKEIKISQHLSIISFDNDEYFNALNDNISSVQRDTYDMGERSMKMLLEIIINPEIIIKTILTPTLVLNGSEKMKTLI